MRGRRAALIATALVSAQETGCHKDPTVSTRTVTLHAPDDCAAGLSNLDSSAFAVYSALGDYEPPPSPGGHLAMTGADLPEIDPSAQVLAVDATEQDRTWQGWSALPAAGSLDVLLLPASMSCAVPGAITPRAGAVLGITGGLEVSGSAGLGGDLGIGGNAQLLVVGGQGTPLPGTMVLRLDTGALGAVTQDLLKPRTGATVTPFGAGALVAGGVDAQTGAVLDEAEVYDPTLGGLDQQHPIELTLQRASAGAVVLATGETLLAGGVGADGATALASMEIVDPVTRTAHAENVAQLAVARVAPSVLRLASGEILVAGGTDASGIPVPTLEWFAPDASHASRRTQDLVTGSARAFLALEAGGALAIVAPPPDAAAGFQDVWVIDADGAIEAGTPIDGPLPAPVLLGGAGGTPVLWTGESGQDEDAGADAGAPVPGRWLQWQPWTGAFGELDVLDDAPAHVGLVTLSPDPGAAFWLDTSTASAPRLTAMRFAVAGPFATLPGPLLVTDTTDVAPDTFAPSGNASFDPAAGLTLAAGVGAFVTDRTYADVQVEVDAPSGAPATVVLRDVLGDEVEVGGAACPSALVTGAPATLTVTRRGAAVAWSVSGHGSGSCPATFAAGARVSVGLRGASGLAASLARNLRITRLGSP